MAIAALTPDRLDDQASRLHDTRAWQRIVTGWERTAAELKHGLRTGGTCCPSPWSS